MEIKQLLQLSVDRLASDLHIIVGIPPHLRVEGELFPIPDEAPVTPELVNKFVKEILIPEQLERLTVNKEIDFSLPFNQNARFRVNAYTQKNSYAIALRRVLREDPDVVLVGEMRDYETIASALTVAETGHLVFATLHTNSAAQ